MKFYLNGEFVREEDAKISVLDHGLLYGDGIFEGIKAYDGYVFKLEEHLNRLYASARTIHLDIPLTRDELKEAILETLRVNKLTDAYIRPIITRGIGDMGLDPRRCTGKPTVIVIARAWRSLFPKEYYEKGLRLLVAHTRTKAPDSLPSSIKSLNYLANVLAKIESTIHGLDDAVMLDPQGYVAEATAENIFIIKNQILSVPPAETNLPGITRQTVIEMAQDSGYKVREELFGVSKLYMSDECFLTGTAAEIVSVVEVDARPIGNGRPGELTMLLQQKFKGLIGKPGTGTPIYP